MVLSRNKKVCISLIRLNDSLYLILTTHIRAKNATIGYDHSINRNFHVVDHDHLSSEALPQMVQSVVNRASYHFFSI